MLNINTNNTNEKNILININNSDNNYDKIFSNDNILSKTTSGVTNGIVDYEIYDYKYKNDKLRYNIFFFKKDDQAFTDEIISNIELNFDEYRKNNINLLSSSLNSFSFRNFKQTDNNLLPFTQVSINKDSVNIVNDKYYAVTDPIHELNLITPTFNGRPMFYNTFTFPFSNNLTPWISDDNKFSNKSFLYNSFLLLECFDNINTINQNRIISLPVFIMDRYMKYEISRNDVKQIRPVFDLVDGCEGYSLFFLKNVGVNELYVKYSFWDSLNGVKIPLIPSSNISKQKKWIQSPNEYNNKNNYLKIVLNETGNTYSIFEYNDNTQLFDIESSEFDLYELIFDEYWSNTIVPNNRPEESLIINEINGVINVNKSSLKGVQNVELIKPDESIFNRFFNLEPLQYKTPKLKNPYSYNTGSEANFDGDKYYYDDNTEFDNIMLAKYFLYDYYTDDIKNIYFSFDFTYKKLINNYYNNYDSIKLDEFKLINNDNISYYINDVFFDELIITQANNTQPTKTDQFTFSYIEQSDNSFDLLYQTLIDYDYTKDRPLNPVYLVMQLIKSEDFKINDYKDNNKKLEFVNKINKKFGENYIKDILNYHVNLTLLPFNININNKQFNYNELESLFNNVDNNLRSYFTGLSLKCKQTNDKLIRPKGEVVFNVDLYIGVISAYFYYNRIGDIDISSNLTIVLRDLDRNNKSVKIPINYKIKLS